MSFVGHSTYYYAQILFAAFSVIAALCFVFHLYFIKVLKIFSIYLLPVLSICICFENVILYYNNEIDNKSALANIAYVLHSLIIPLFCLIEYEISFRLYEAKGAHFCFIRFDQGEDMSPIVAPIALWIMRLIALGLFVISIMVNFNFVPKASEYTGRGGYITLANNKYSLSMWLNLIPPIYLSILSFLTAFTMYRYGNNLSLTFGYNRRWRLLIPCAVAQAVGQIFATSVYPVTSNGGEIVLLIGLTNSVFLIQHELILAGTFATFLHKSNIAFHESVIAAVAAAAAQIELPPIAASPSSLQSSATSSLPRHQRSLSSRIESWRLMSIRLDDLPIITRRASSIEI
eukprot:gene8688-17947_t